VLETCVCVRTCLIYEIYGLCKICDVYVIYVMIMLYIFCLFGWNSKNKLKIGIMVTLLSVTLAKRYFVECQGHSTQQRRHN
jgi:hypothetical protein